MGICSMAYFNPHNSIVVETNDYPTGEHFFTKKGSDMSIADNTQYEKNQVSISLINSSRETSSLMIKVFLCNNNSAKVFNPLGETELKHGKDIIYNTTFVFDYYFHKDQLLKFIICDGSKEISETVIAIGKIMGSKGNSISIPMTPKQVVTNEQGNSPKNNDPFAQLLVDGRKIMTTKYQATLNITIDILNSGSNIDNYFYFIDNYNDGKNWRNVYKSEEFKIDNTCHVYDNSVSISTGVLCKNDKSKDIKLELYNIDKRMIVGEGVFQIKQVINNKHFPISIYNKDNREIAVMKVDYIEKEICSFLDYIKTGMQIVLMVGIDYTQLNHNNSNGDNKNSLESEANNYEKTIIECGSKIAYYNYDQQFPVFGFGGKPISADDNIQQHCFPVNMTKNPNVIGIQGIIQAYRDSLGKITQGNLRCCSEVIKQVTKTAKEEKDSHIIKYYVLMILIDGPINDIEETKNAVITASEYSISIIIIGIGNADYSKMMELNGNITSGTTSPGIKAKRDIVQFVQFNKYKNGHEPLPYVLSEDVLQDIPRQVEEYFEIDKTCRYSLFSN